ncbi:MAG TPA: hypothetical protein VEK07_16820 [Polyangiaceae bacterium]|nr:hypothetical protein [Polyangiaceae bacterium]
MTLAIFAFGGCLLAAALSEALSRAGWRREYEDPVADLLDRIASWGLLAIAVWIASSWVLVLTGVLRKPALVATGSLELLGGAFWLYRLRGPGPKHYPSPGGWTAAAVLIGLLPVVLWTAFVAWRGTLLPVYNHDALAYHFPKAVLIARAGRLTYFDVPEMRIAAWPWNYELLLADAMILTGTDGYCALLGTFAYIVLGVMSARIAASWWGRGAHVALVAAAVLTAPIVVLHSGLHKSDLLLAVFAVASLMWAARWCAAGCFASCILATIALLAAIGTKLNAAFTVAAAAPILVLGLLRHRRGPGLVRTGGLFVVAAAVGSLLLGAAAYVVDLGRVTSLIDSGHQLGPATVYGDWSAIWQYTAMVLIAPFSASGNAVWNPFRREYWWWPSNDVWASHFGALFSILVGLLVPSLLLWRFKPGLAAGSQSGLSAERRLASLAALAGYVLTLPIHSWPVGFFSTYGRYVAFVLPFVAAWTLSPISLALERAAGRWAGVLSVSLGCGMAAVGVASVWQFGIHDAYAPIEWVAYMMDHGEDRLPFVRRNRAASVFDKLAGPDERCAIDVGFDTWVYPAYGKAWTRNVDFLRPTPGPVVIPETADWVVVDRSWNVFFGHPQFVDMGKAALLGHGRPSGADLKVYRQLIHDPRFELVYDDRAQNQAVFHRRAVALAPAGGPESP